MTQPTPNVTAADVDRIVARDFPPGDRARVMAALEEYGRESWHNEIVRVRVALLKLAAGDAARLAIDLDVAKTDYRDVLAAAEYPLYSLRPFEKMPDAEREQIIASDWAQYQDWLTR